MKNRKLFEGPRGGIFYIKKGKKVYVLQNTNKLNNKLNNKLSNRFSSGADDWEYESEDDWEEEKPKPRRGDSRRNFKKVLSNRGLTQRGTPGVSRDNSFRHNVNNVIVGNIESLPTDRREFGQFIGKQVATKGAAALGSVIFPGIGGQLAAKCAGAACQRVINESDRRRDKIDRHEAWDRGGGRGVEMQDMSHADRSTYFGKKLRSKKKLIKSRRKPSK
jgi:hypothetical protein